MSITDDVRAAEPRPGDSGAGDARSATDRQFDRTPPQDVAAEQCVLGGMLLSKDAIADVVEILRAADFYRPSHSTIFDAVLDLYGRGEPADPITVAAALADSGDLARIGGAPYLHTLIASVPTAANAAYYARIVSERAVLRRLVEAGTRIVQLGYGGAAAAGRDVDEIVDIAQQAVYDVTERRISEDFAVLAEMLQPTLDEIEAVGAQGGVMTGVPTGFSDLDRLLNGLHPGQLIVVAGRPGLGKALALDTPLATPQGWTTMGSVAPGDSLLGADGRPTTVLATSPVMLGRRCYEVEFCDGTVIVADGEHRWWTCAGDDTVGAVRTTDEIAATVRGPRVGGPGTHSVPTCRPLALPACELAIAPYPLGVWLAGACSVAGGRVTARDPEILFGVGRGDVGRGDVDRGDVGRGDVGRASLGAADVAGYRRIPQRYLRAGEKQRRELLAGLLDGAGRVEPDGRVLLPVRSASLAEDVTELVTGLGYVCPPPATGPDGYRVSFTAPDDVFGLERKRLAHKKRRDTLDARSPDRRFIVDVRLTASVPVRCVTVDSPDRLYLAGRAMVPTHNSTAAMDFARAASVRNNLASAIFSLEMSKVEIVMRLLAAESRVPLHVLRSGQLSDDDWTKLARRMGEISEAPLFVDDTPNMNLMEIRAKARRLRQRNDLKLIIVDYLQLMTSPKRVESRQQEVAELSRGLKLLAKEIECPVVAVSQLNRGPEQRTDKRPQLSDLRESGCLTATTRVLRADTNVEVTLGELLRTRARDVPVWALDERLRLVVRPMTHVFASGVKDVFRMRLVSGKEIEATANHPFLTVDGWMPLAELAVGTPIAVPRQVPAALGATGWSDARVVLAANLVLNRFGLPRVSGRSGLRHRDTAVPAAVFGLPNRQVALFLRHLWASDAAGTVSAAGTGRIRYRSVSRPLLDDITLLLLRFGISSRLRTIPSGEGRYVLEIAGRDDQLRFLRRIGVRGPHKRAAAVLRAGLRTGTGNPAAQAVCRQVRREVHDILSPQPQPQPSGTADAAGVVQGDREGGRQPLARVAAVLDEVDLDLHVTNDVRWDEVASIDALGVREVYDAQVGGLHNFLANGIAVHNSIEQDADVVILLHRDDYYDRESPRAGEADFIVAKHRNGPTDTVTVAAQLHLSRFVDMAIV